MDFQQTQQIKLREQMVYNLCREVIKNCPEIKDEVIGIEFDLNRRFTILETYYVFSLFGCGNRVKRTKAKIIIPYSLMDKKKVVYNDEEIKSIIAHELLGHYKRNKLKDKTRKIVNRRISWRNQIEGLEERKHSIERLEKCSLLIEIYADNEAVKVGYGKSRLSVLKRYEKEYESQNCFLEQGPKEVRARIANLEEKLRSA